VVYECSTWKKFYWKVLEDGREQNGIARECDKPCSQRKMLLVLSRSEHAKSTTNTATTNELAISTGSDSKKNSNALVSDHPDTPGAASATPDLFSGGTIGKIEGCSFTFNLVARDLNKDRKPRKRHIIVSDDSDSE